MQNNNKVDVLVGTQWGDEGKGKIIDVLAEKYDIIARFQGGPNAGHTLEFEGQKHILHQIPSGIFYPGKINFLGNGMVIDLIAFQKEIEGLLPYISMEELTKRVIIARGAHIILPTHRLLDAAMETAKGAKKIGSTLKGIGPCYTDKTSRCGISIGKALGNDFKTKHDVLRNQHLRLIVEFFGGEIDEEKLMEDERKLFEAIEFLRNFQTVNGPYWINKQMDAGKTVLVEGAQGTMLDVEFGHYPFVTCSNTISGGICTGLGIAPNRIGKIYGLFKAYCTRVGSGPFPTELGGEDSEKWCANTTSKEENDLYPDADINDANPFIQGIALRRKGFETGATTGRLRRCGNTDLVELKYACMLNGVTELVISKADVLSGFETIKVCTGYEIDGVLTDEMPMEIDESMIPRYVELPGWNDLSTAESIAALPKSFKDFLHFIEKEMKLPITIISIGPDRKNVIMYNA